MTLHELRNGIMVHLGGDPRTITQNMAVMLSSGLITDIGNSRFQINFKKIHSND